MHFLFGPHCLSISALHARPCEVPSLVNVRFSLLMVNLALDCSPALDRAFGPVCACRDFDLMLSFEQIIFDIDVSSLFLVLLPFCLLIRLKTSQN